MIKDKDLENKDASKYANPKYKPVNLADSIAWHEHLLIGLKQKAEKAKAAYDTYCYNLYTAEKEKQAADPRPDLAPVKLAGILLPSDDETLRRLKVDRDQTAGDVAGMQNKIQRLRNYKLLHGDIKF